MTLFVQFLACFSALGVIVAPSLVVSVLFLVAAFLATGVFLVIEGSAFVGLSYLLVYIGAIAILFLFVVMLMDLREVKSTTSAGSHNSALPLAFLSGILILGLSQITGPAALAWTPTASELFLAKNTLIVEPVSQVSSIGSLLFQEGTVPVIMAAMLLLVAIIGPLTLCLPKSNSSNSIVVITPLL